MIALLINAFLAIIVFAFLIWLITLIPFPATLTWVKTAFIGLLCLIFIIVLVQWIPRAMGVLGSDGRGTRDSIHSVNPDLRNHAP